MKARRNLSTLCYIEKDGKYLMLHRIKKTNDINQGKWIGVGGHFEQDETPEECLLREVKEETGFTLQDFRLRGILTFLADDFPAEYIFLYTANQFNGEQVQCDEGVLEWIKKEDISSLALWEGDRVFFHLLDTTENVFSLKLRYEGDRLVESVLNGIPMT